MCVCVCVDLLRNYYDNQKKGMYKLRSGKDQVGITGSTQNCIELQGADVQQMSRSQYR